MRSRAVIIVIALLLGGTAAVLAAQYLNSARSEIQSQAKPVEVMVAQEDIPRGTTAEELFTEKMVALEQVPQQFVASDAISSQRAIEGQVLAVPLSSGEQLTVGRFQFPRQAGLAYSVPEDYVAISIPIDDVSGVSGFLKPGDNIALMATLQQSGGGGTGAGQDLITKTLIPKARVLAVGQTVGVETTQEQQDSGNAFASASADNGAQDAPKTVTLALSPKDAERVVFVLNDGTASFRSLWVALLPVRSTGVNETHGQTIYTALD